MAERLVLMGAKEGPWCGISEVRNPVLNIRGLNGVLTARIRTSSGFEYGTLFEEDGSYILPEIQHEGKTCRPSWIQLSCDTATRKLLCLVRSAEAA